MQLHSGRFPVRDGCGGGLRMVERMNTQWSYDKCGRTLDRQIYTRDSSNNPLIDPFNVRQITVHAHTIYTTRLHSQRSYPRATSDKHIYPKKKQTLGKPNTFIKYGRSSMASAKVNERAGERSVRHCDHKNHKQKNTIIKSQPQTRKCGASTRPVN